MNDVNTNMSNAEAARRAHEWIVQGTDLYANVLEHAGRYDSKIEVDENASLAAHVLNAVTVAINGFVYEAYDPSEGFLAYEEDVRVLAAATALHDTNKYLREAYGIDTEGNTKEAFDHYFGETDAIDGEADDFGIEDDLLGTGYRDDLLYLVQRCEIGESGVETRGIDTNFRGLERYVRLGDQIASIAQRDGVSGVYQRLGETFDDDVHLETFQALEQPILNELLVGSVKEVVSGEGEADEYGVVIGSTSDAVVYLGEPVELEVLRTRIGSRLSERITEDFDFTCKLNWNSFDYDILSEVGLSPEKKEQIIADEFRELLGDGTAGVEAFEHVPDEFDEYFAILAKCIYLDGRSDFDDSDVQQAYDRIKEDKGAQKVKIHFIAYLVEHFAQHHDFLAKLSDELRSELHEDLEPETDAIGASIDRFFGNAELRDLGPKDEMCFLCGAEAESAYKKGASAVYRTYEYSRRLPPHAQYKSICAVCNLEYALFADVCEQRDISTRNSLEMAFLYFDDFLGDVRVRGGRIGNLVQGDTVDLDGPEVATRLVKPQYLLQPIYVLDDNHRMRVVRQLMEAARRSGLKVVLGRPFTRFQSTDVVFEDENATRQQELLGLDRIERFGPLPEFADGARQSHLRRALELFDIMSMVGRDAGMSNPYIQLDRDEFHTIVHFAVVNHDHATRLSALRSYLDTYHGGDLMEMKNLAQTGIDLFGTTRFDSKYKKTKVFREALDAILTGMSQGMENDRLAEYAEGQIYALSDSEKYAGRVAPSDAEAFVAEIFAYLEDNDLKSLKKLSDWENALVNSYYYACEHNFEEDDDE